MATDAQAQALANTIIHRMETQPSESVSVTITRGQRGGYGWEIKASGPTLRGTLELVTEGDAQLDQQFGGRGGI